MKGMQAHPGKNSGESPLDLAAAPLNPPLAAPFPLRASEDGPPEANNLCPLAAGALAADPAEEEGKAKGLEEPNSLKSVSIACFSLSEEYKSAHEGYHRMNGVERVVVVEVEMLEDLKKGEPLMKTKGTREVKSSEVLVDLL